MLMGLFFWTRDGSHVHVWKILLLFGSLMAIGCGIAQIAISAVTLRDIDALRPCLESNGCPCKMLYDRNFCKSTASSLSFSSVKLCKPLRKFLSCLKNSSF